MKITIDGNEAAARVAYLASEVVAIYPITPSSSMGELSDSWSAAGRHNLWGQVPEVVEMQSEAGAAGALHGALQAGALCTTFTSSQGLLLMVPVMYKIAGELTPAVFHVAARAVATQGLSIFGEHSDVMATRGTGWGILWSATVQEATDLALVAHAATLEARVPFVHAFDGFRTSHELRSIDPLDLADVRALIDEKHVAAHRARALTPDRPVVRGTAHNPDTFFQAREAANPFYAATPHIVARAMDRLAQRTGRQYHLFDYEGAPDATEVIVAMGSGCEAVAETVRALNSGGRKVGVVKVRLFRPFSVQDFVASIPGSVRAVAVLDRTKEPGSAGEPLYQDVVTALAEAGRHPRVVGGRYGLGSREFTPAMAKAVFDQLTLQEPRNHFTVGVHDDVSRTSLDWDPTFITEPRDTVRAMFWGLGSDGTVGANRSAAAIIGRCTEKLVQAYFVFDSKKSGTLTVSHLRFGEGEVGGPYLIQQASFIGVHQWGYMAHHDVLGNAEPGGTVLINCPFPADQAWLELPAHVQDIIRERNLSVYLVDAYGLARELGLGRRINTIMQVGFFALAGVMPLDAAIAQIKESVRKTYGKRGAKVVASNLAAVDAAAGRLERLLIPDGAPRGPADLEIVPETAPVFVREVTAALLAGRGDSLPVGALPVDGTWPVGTARWEKRGLALQVPVWDESICIQCGKCVLVCPHSVVRAKVVPPDALGGAPPTLASLPASWREFPGQRYVLAISNLDCTGCALCHEVCPASTDHRSLEMRPADEAPDTREAWEFFLGLPDSAGPLEVGPVKNAQLVQPRFEFPGACMGCGETPYLKLISQLYGDRVLVANATGCSSIFGGNLPTTPWSTDRDGRGPAWSNSLFEDNAEFGLGMRLASDRLHQRAMELATLLTPALGHERVQFLLAADPSNPEGLEALRQDVAAVAAQLALWREAPPPALAEVDADGKLAEELAGIVDYLVAKQVWIVGGDGWAYDIGYGGLDHVLATGRNVNVLVLDTEVYSNTGGQASKSTPLGAIAKFAAAGKRAGKKDLALLAMTYGHVYVAQVAYGAADAQFIKAFREAAAYDGPSLIIAYSPCIAHGFDMVGNLDHQKAAVNSGHWPLFRFDPRRAAAGRNPLQFDSKEPSLPLADYLMSEGRFRQLSEQDPETFTRLAAEGERYVRLRRRRLEALGASFCEVAPTPAH
ncbi:MAG: pyruvate:ferredoxin (flavodoxin) oxidoreductase [Candidatus Sericytochromatia bacterium]|nr:pyruvate:ferredoxin (flavodoxin) oxidoreductase [Candidatus Tanganyikabacteria bacterium]